MRKNSLLRKDAPACLPEKFANPDADFYAITGLQGIAGITAGGTSNTSFHWIIYGVRKGYENYEVIRDNPMSEKGSIGKGVKKQAKHSDIIEKLKKQQKLQADKVRSSSHMPQASVGQGQHQ